MTKILAAVGVSMVVAVAVGTLALVRMSGLANTTQTLFSDNVLPLTDLATVRESSYKAGCCSATWPWP